MTCVLVVFKRASSRVIIQHDRYWTRISSPNSRSKQFVLKQGNKRWAAKTGNGSEERRRLDSHQALPDLLSLASVLDASRQVCNTVFDSVGQALEAIANSLGAGGVVDGLTKTTARSAYKAASST